MTTQIGCRMHENTKQKNIDTAILISNTGDFQAKKILRDKGHFIMVKWVKSIGIYKNIKFGCT